MVARGVDVSVRRDLDSVLLDERFRLVERRRRQTKDDLAQILAARGPDIVAIDSPPKLGRIGGSRLCERKLLGLGIHCYFTPSDAEQARNPFNDWMWVGFDVFEAAKRAGYSLFVGTGKLRRHAIEVFPHGSAVSLTGCLPPSGTCRRSSRKRAWRAAVLHANGVDASELRSIDEVDAALAALTGLYALQGKYWTVGDADDGVIVLPGEEPARSFSRERDERVD